MFRLRIILIKPFPLHFKFEHPTKSLKEKRISIFILHILDPQVSFMFFFFRCTLPLSPLLCGDLPRLESIGGVATNFSDGLKKAFFWCRAKMQSLGAKKRTRFCNTSTTRVREYPHEGKTFLEKTKSRGKVE